MAWLLAKPNHVSKQVQKSNQSDNSFFFKFNFIYLFFIQQGFFLVYLFLAALGLCCCTQAFSSCGEQGLLFVVVRGLLIGVASLVAEHGL